MPLDADRTRIARELVGWSQERLAWSAGVPVKAVQALEETGLIRAVHEQRLRSALERAGIEFISGPGVIGPGVRFRPSGSGRV
jgi:hypothetical protein